MLSAEAVRISSRSLSKGIELGEVASYVSVVSEPTKVRLSQPARFVEHGHGWICVHGGKTQGYLRRPCGES